MSINVRYCLLALLSLASFIFLMISSTIKPYGFFIDELYFLACANHPALEPYRNSLVVYCEDCTRPQREVEIYVMRRPRVSIEKEWDGFKEYH